MTDDLAGHEGTSEDSGGWDATDAPTTGSTPRVEDRAPHSRLVGLMALPISPAVPIRRSTALMLIAFLGFGTLCYLFPPSSSTTANTQSTVNGGIPGVFVPATTTTTTTTRPTAPTAPTATTQPPRPTSTTPTSSSTTTPTATTTTTRPGGPTTTTTGPTGATTTTQAGATTTSSP